MFLDEYSEKSINHLKTQFSYLKNSIHINLIIKFEKYTSGLQNILDLISFPKQGEIPNERKITYDNYKITPKFIDDVNKYYKVDFMTYNYKMITIQNDINYSDLLSLINY